MKPKPKTYWLCEKFINMVPMAEYYTSSTKTLLGTTINANWADRFPDRQTCSDQCPPGFFPTEHTDA